MRTTDEMMQCMHEFLSALPACSAQPHIRCKEESQNISHNFPRSNHLRRSATMPSFAKVTTCILLALSAPHASAFAPPSSKSVQNAVQSSSSLLMGPPKSDVILEETYGEGSRKYRRTVYTHNEWVKHRTSDRFIRNLTSMVNSGVYKSLAREVLATTGVAAFLVLWNAVAGGYTDFNGVQHAAAIDALPQLTLPLTPFTLLSPSLGLLLGKSSSTFIW